jgi:hypothetical protein
LNGYVEFNYHGRHQELVRRRITPDDVVWASEPLDGLSDRQWQDAFRAGGYAPDVAARFIRRSNRTQDRVGRGLRGHSVSSQE